MTSQDSDGRREASAADKHPQRRGLRKGRSLSPVALLLKVWLSGPAGNDLQVQTPRAFACYLTRRAACNGPAHAKQASDPGSVRQGCGSCRLRCRIRIRRRSGWTSRLSFRRHQSFVIPHSSEASSSTMHLAPPKTAPKGSSFMLTSGSFLVHIGPAAPKPILCLAAAWLDAKNPHPSLSLASLAGLANAPFALQRHGPQQKNSIDATQPSTSSVPLDQRLHMLTPSSLCPWAGRPWRGATRSGCCCSLAAWPHSL